MPDKLYLHYKRHDSELLLIGVLSREQHTYSFMYLSHDDGEPVNFVDVQYPPLKFTEYLWYKSPKGFSDMIISPDRENLDVILRRLKMTEYDAWEYLRRTKGMSETHNWSFELEPIGRHVKMLNTDETLSTLVREYQNNPYTDE